MSAPYWWKSPEEQLQRARELWPNVTLPEPPEFTPQTETEVLLLHVPQRFAKLWEIIMDTVSPYSGADSGAWPKHNKTWRPIKKEHRGKDPLWVGFDPNPPLNDRSKLLTREVEYAGSELLSAIIQFPDLYWIWAAENRFPCFSGYKIRIDEHWLPSLSQLSWNHSNGLVEITTWIQYGDDEYTFIPTIRKC